VTIEVIISPRIGELRLDDVAPSVRSRLGVADELLVTVRSTTGAILVARVGLTTKTAGLRQHLELACLRCGRPARVLRVGPDDRLACQRCCPRLTARQRERTTAYWCRFDGERTDRLVRLALRKGAPRLGLMGQIGEQLVRADQARLEALAPKLTAVLALGGDA
jgi:hypothetical protein